MRKTGSTISCLWPTNSDHAVMPVMLPRKSDSDMRRDGPKAACEPPKTAVDEPGRMHSVPNLECRLGSWRSADGPHLPIMIGDSQWRRRRETRAQLRRQDKSRPSQGLPSLCLYIVFLRDKDPDREIPALAPREFRVFRERYRRSSSSLAAAGAYYSPVVNIGDSWMFEE